MMSSGSTDALLATPQVSLKKGLKMFSPDGLAAVKKEMQQLHDSTVMKPQTGKELTPDQKCMALAYLMFLRHKDLGRSKDMDVLMVASNVHMWLERMQPP